MFDAKDITKIADSLHNVSQDLNNRTGYQDPSIEYVVDHRNELECLRLYGSGWTHDGFDYVDNSNDIMVFWVRGDERVGVQLTVKQQRRWLQRIQEMEGEV